MNIVIATQNKGKVVEIKEAFKSMNVNVYTMEEIGLNPDIEENGTTFEENALIKVNELHRELPEEDKMKYIIMSDDSGLEIEALDNKPGIYSARYNGVDTPWTTKNELMVEEMKDFENRNARFVSCIAIRFPCGETQIVRGIVEGDIAYELKGDRGFGYDRIFIPKGYDVTFAEMSLEEKGEFSHRARAIEFAKEVLEEKIQSFK
ncbi:MAG: RdgB/HAM1 family non-canonical purine NTP pyrophosphatase [Lachnospirales bacterium]